MSDVIKFHPNPTPFADLWGLWNPESGRWMQGVGYLMDGPVAFYDEHEAVESARHEIEESSSELSPIIVAHLLRPDEHRRHYVAMNHMGDTIAVALEPRANDALVRLDLGLRGHPMSEPGAVVASVPVPVKTGGGAK